jgi:hypothetical protein
VVGCLAQQHPRQLAIPSRLALEGVLTHLQYGEKVTARPRRAVYIFPARSGVSALRRQGPSPRSLEGTIKTLTNFLSYATIVSFYDTWYRTVRRLDTFLA